MTGLSLITANVPLLKPLLKELQSGLIDSSVPKLSSGFQLSNLGSSNKHFKQQSPTEARSYESKNTQDRRRQLSTSVMPLTNNQMTAPRIEDINDAAQDHERDGEWEASSIWGISEIYARR